MEEKEEIVLEEPKNLEEQNTSSENPTPAPKKKNKNTFLIILAVVVVLACAFAVWYFVFRDTKKDTKKPEVIDTPVEKLEGDFRITGNGLEAFDLAFLQLNNDEKNTVYSPLSIKYALFMLADGANGDTKKEITDIIGDYKPVAYVNSANMSLANAMFVRDSFKNNVKEDYLTTIKTKYNAEVIFDPFKDATNINNWISDKTFKLLENVMDDNTVQDLDFALINALAIDMEWNKLLSNQFLVHFPHEEYNQYTSDVRLGSYDSVTFEDGKKYAAIKVAATINNYDIVKELGEDTIRKEVGDAFDKYYADPANSWDTQPDKEEYLNQYIEDINANYGYAESSTDFMVYQDETVTAFAKDLKEYNGTQLEYVAIVPNEMALKDYIKNVKTSDVANVIENLKEIKSANFEQGYVTKIEGNIPMFKYEYSLPLLENLKALGISKVFGQDADLSNIANNAYVPVAIHKANIEFSNEGIKASAASVVGGAGAAGGGFDYIYDVPVKEIKLDFNKPYLYLIRDKKTGEVWFTGKVYTPCEYEAYQAEHRDSSMFE